MKIGYKNYDNIMMDINATVSFSDVINRIGITR